jgi:hypothetical protein
VSSETYDMSAAGGLIEELKSLASTSFISFECVHISRGCNTAAHALAALGVGSTEGEVHVSCDISRIV